MASGPPFSPTPPLDPREPRDRYAPGSRDAGDQHAGDQHAGDQPGRSSAWLPPARLTPPSSGAPFGGGDPGYSRPPAMYELRPLSTGELLDRTFSLYRSRFWLFAGISALAGVFQTAGQAVQLVLQHALLRRGNPITTNVTTSGLSLILLVLYWLLFSLTQAATVWAVSEVYLRRSAAVRSALGAVLPRWYRFLGIAAWQVGSGSWLPALVAVVVFGLAFAGRKSVSSSPVAAGVAVFFLILLLVAAGVVGFLLYLRNLLAVPAAVVEQLTVRPAMRRSKQLAPGGKGKLFLVLLISALLYGVVNSVAGVLLVFGLIPAIAGRWQVIAQVIGLGVNFLGFTVVSPIAMVGITLTYFDQRVRKEAFDVAVLLGDAATPLFAANGEGHGTDRPTAQGMAGPPVRGGDGLRAGLAGGPPQPPQEAGGPPS